MKYAKGTIRPLSGWVLIRVDSLRDRSHTVVEAGDTELKGGERVICELGNGREVRGYDEKLWLFRVADLPAVVAQEPN